jgi:hypothetical protein
MTGPGIAAAAVAACMFSSGYYAAATPLERRAATQTATEPKGDHR